MHVCHFARTICAAATEHLAKISVSDETTENITP